MGPSWEAPAEPCCARCDLGEGLSPLPAPPLTPTGLPFANLCDWDGEGTLLLSMLQDFRCMTCDPIGD